MSLVSIVIPCRNEARYIGRCLDSILANDFPSDQLEILVVDGMSDDGTRDVVASYCQRHPFLRLLDNPRRTTPVALNIGVRLARGSIVMPMSAHSTCPRDYVGRCVEASRRLGADDVGGNLVTRPIAATPIAEAIGVVLGHRFGVGNAEYRVSQATHGERDVDTVPFGCYRREVFDRIGYFDERLTRNQDLEFNIRLRASGGRIVLLPDVQIYYHPRTDLGGFLRHNFRTGIWALYSAHFGRRAFELRHLVPGMFVGSLLGSGVAGLVWPRFWWLTAAAAASYLIAMAATTVMEARRRRAWRLLATLLPVFAGLHLAYGLGTVVGLFQAIVTPEFWRRVLLRGTTQPRPTRRPPT